MSESNELSNSCSKKINTKKASREKRLARALRLNIQRRKSNFCYDYGNKKDD